MKARVSQNLADAISRSAAAADAAGRDGTALVDAKVIERRAGAPTSYPSDYDANSNLEFACQLLH